MVQSEEDVKEISIPGIAVPFAACACLLVILYLILPYTAFLTMLGLIVAYLVPPAGKETVIPLGIVLGLPWWLVAFTMTFFDVIGAILVTWNFHLARKIPRFGPWMERMMSGGREYFDARPWLERLYFLGLILFVMVPFESSGGISAAILGRMIGMRARDVVLCVATGAAISCFGIALGSDAILSLLARDFVLGIIAILVLLLGIGVFLVVRYSYRRRKTKN